MKDFLLITPPFTQLNTPYPATPYLKGFLNTKGFSSYQMDLGIEVILELFTSKRLHYIFEAAFENDDVHSENSQRILALREDYIKSIDPVILFLQGKNPTLARQICTGNFLPQASRFEHLEELEWAFGSMGIQDQAKHLATLYLEDISDFITECIDENFGFSQYAERLGRSANTFDEIHKQLEEDLNYIDSISLKLLDLRLQEFQPKIVCISVPFPGNLFSAFRCAQYIKKKYPNIKTAMGGGFPNTELRSLTEPRVFDYFDFVSLDDGELPIELIYNSLSSSDENFDFKRTYTCENGVVVYNDSSTKSDYRQADLGTPDYSDLFLDAYISVIGIANPMHSLWSDGRWNKLTMAHGCYWGKCTFCDISLDYIRLYEPLTAALLVDRMEEIIEQTGETGFHFVDEAAPPALMRALAIEIIHRKLVVTWWTNIRFEKSFTHDLCTLLKHSGCIAISGGLEVASDRLLALIDKGVTVEQVARVTRNLTDSGILVHSYLMYGYPTQTIQETIDSLEMVRQLFELGIIQSGFWHQFALTTHSPIGEHPDKYGLMPENESISFAHNDIQFKDKTGIHHDKFSFGLKKSLFNFMHGIGFEIPVNEWFDFKVPRTKISPDFIESSINSEPFPISKPSSKPIWLGGTPLTSNYSDSKKGRTIEMTQLTMHLKNDCIEINLEEAKAEWLMKQLEDLSIFKKDQRTLSQLKSDFESKFGDFEIFWYSKPIMTLKETGLLIM
ncbi:MAG: B12-binding domain-containing radical SAM protein [Crocinitomicaceae bacterium]|nr:B12-binding domain-containing radical SAM protein [Crocinitomicaceae bacterium]